MVQIIEENRKPKFIDQLMGGLAQASQQGSVAIPAMIGQNIQKKERNEALQRLTGKDLSGLPIEFQKMFAEKMAKSPEHERIVKAFESFGFSPEEAEFYSILTQGGQTAVVKDLLEGRKRAGGVRKKIGQPSAGIQGQTNEGPQEPQQQLTPEEAVKEQIQDIVEEADAGLTPAEKVARSNKRYDENLKIYQDAGEKLRGMARDKERLDILNKLSESKKLPENLGRLNVTKEGNLRLPFFASAEAERYVKTLNEFSAGAKDTFGSRVTNFDLQQYLLRYPNLLNSAEGRRQLLQQMKIVNQINSVYYKNLKSVYDNAGGVRNIDADAAERLAEQITEPQINELRKKFDEVGTFPTLPDASQFEGRSIKNEKTGEILTAKNGQWVPKGTK